MGSTKGAVALEHAAISNMISGLSTRNIEESACEAVLIEPVSNPSTLISMEKTFVSVTTDESNHVGKLFNTAYMEAKEQMPFTKE